MNRIKQWLSVLRAMLTPGYVVNVRRVEQARRREDVRRNARSRL
jgi:hypothetical protein